MSSYKRMAKGLVELPLNRLYSEDEQQAIYLSLIFEMVANRPLAGAVLGAGAIRPTQGINATLINLLGGR